MRVSEHVKPGKAPPVQPDHRPLPLRWLRPRARVVETSKPLSDRADNVVIRSEMAAGMVLYVLGRELWRRGPLRGGLSCFGASPQLDRCASQERYLAEKLAELSHAVLGGSATLSRISQLHIQDRKIALAVEPVVAYAKQVASAGKMFVSPELSKAWSLFVAQVVDHQQSMRGLTDKIYYPTVPGVGAAQAHMGLQIVNVTEPLRKFSKGCGDCSDALKQLMSELQGGTAKAALQTVLAACLFGFAIGCELEAHIPEDFPATQIRQMRRFVHV